MKKYAAALTFLTVLFQSTSAMAWIGGPYSNNTADGKSGGVFQGTITMKNGSGMFRFSTGQEPFNSPNAESVVFHEGLVFYGDCFGQVDFHAKRVSGITNGNTALGGGVTPIGAPVFPFSNGNDAFICNTQWAGKMRKVYPGLTFRAKGWAYIFDSNYQNNTSTTITTDFAPVDLPNDGGTVTTTVTQTISSNQGAPKTKVKIKVYGSRVSPVAYTAFGTATPTP